MLGVSLINGGSVPMKDKVGKARKQNTVKFVTYVAEQTHELQNSSVQMWGREKKISSCRDSRFRLHYTHFCHFRYCRMKTTRGLSRRKIESVFGHFTKFNIRKTDASQNSLAEKWTLHKIQ